MPGPPNRVTVRAQLGALLPQLRTEHGVRSLAVFGAYARGETAVEGPLELLVEFEEVPGLFAFAALQFTLQDMLGVRVDLSTRPMLRDRLVPRLESELVSV